MKTILITGGSGLVGTQLALMLIEKGYKVIILSRNIGGGKRVIISAQISYAAWDPAAGTIDAAAIDQTDAIIHLAGENVADHRWTKKRKQAILLSRTQSAELIIKALKDIPNKVTTVITASATGWYGPDQRNPSPRTEELTHYPDFLGETCFAWENSMLPVKALGKRLVIVRSGLALSNESGAYPEFKKSLRFKVATILGSGKQVVPWIHIVDLCRIYMFGLEVQSLQGIYNAVAPQIVTNKELIKTIAAIKQPSFYIPLRVPAFLLKIVLGEMSVEVLKSVTVSTAKIKMEGFQFRYPSIQAAVEDLQ